MRAIVAHDLLLLIRARCFRVVLTGYVLIFLGVSWLWYSEFVAQEGVVAVQEKPKVFQQVLLSQSILLVGLTPWVVARLMRHGRGNSLVRRIALTFLPPWKVALGTLVAGMVYLCQLLILSFPSLILAYLLGLASVPDIGWAYAKLFVWLTLVQLSTFGWNIRLSNALHALVMSYLTLLLLSVGRFYLARMYGESMGGHAFIGLIGLEGCLGFLLLCYCNKRLMYLRD